MERYIIDLRDLRPYEVFDLFAALYSEKLFFTFVSADDVIIVVTDKDLSAILYGALPSDLFDSLNINEIA